MHTAPGLVRSSASLPQFYRRGKEGTQPGSPSSRKSRCVLRGGGEERAGYGGRARHRLPQDRPGLGTRPKLPPREIPQPRLLPASQFPPSKAGSSAVPSSWERGLPTSAAGEPRRPRVPSLPPQSCLAVLGLSPPHGEAPGLLAPTPPGPPPGTPTQAAGCSPRLWPWGHIHHTVRGPPWATLTQPT